MIKIYFLGATNLIRGAGWRAADLDDNDMLYSVVTLEPFHDVVISDIEKYSWKWWHPAAKR